MKNISILTAGNNRVKVHRFQSFSRESHWTACVSVRCTYWWHEINEENYKAEIECCGTLLLENPKALSDSRCFRPASVALRKQNIIGHTKHVYHEPWATYTRVQKTKQNKILFLVPKVSLPKVLAVSPRYDCLTRPEHCWQETQLPSG